MAMNILPNQLLHAQVCYSSNRFRRAYACNHLRKPRVLSPFRFLHVRHVTENNIFNNKTPKQVLTDESINPTLYYYVSFQPVKLSKTSLSLYIVKLNSLSFSGKLRLSYTIFIL